MKYKFVVSGSAETEYCGEEALAKAEQIGREIVRQGGILITGATTGIPHAAAKGAKAEGGVSVGMSPAASLAAHVKSYKLPVDYFDFIIYTGFDYSGRNLLLVKAADAVIVVCGGIGTLNEFTIALEDDKPIGVLIGSGGASDQIADLLKNIKDPHRHGRGRVVFESDPRLLLEKLLAIVKEENQEESV